MILLDGDKIVGNTEWQKPKYEVECMEKKCDKFFLAETNNKRQRCPACKLERKQFLAYKQWKKRKRQECPVCFKKKIFSGKKCSWCYEKARLKAQQVSKCEA